MSGDLCRTSVGPLSDLCRPAGDWCYGGSGVVTEARIGCELELMRKPPPLGGERGEFEGGWAMCPDVRNPAFPRAIPHGTLVFTQFPKVVFFGLSPGCHWVHSPVGDLGGSGDRSRGCLRANWTPVGVDIGPQVSPF